MTLAPSSSAAASASSAASVVADEKAEEQKAVEKEIQGKSIMGRPSIGRSSTMGPSSSASITTTEITTATTEDAAQVGGGGGGFEDANDSVDPSDVSSLSILRLDLSLDDTRSRARNVMSSLERNSIGRLISARLESSLSHLAHLQARVMSTTSRVLVTGDLNAGKSTLVNALLRRGGVDEQGWPTGVMPVDQQPLTGRFIEVFPVANGEEEEGERVVLEDGSVKGLEALNELAGEPMADAAPLKVYLKQDVGGEDTKTILHENGVLDISLVDAPGLNRDVIHTTATFTRQPSIDVVVFVVSAANHFTLSAKEFILTAGQEKARMFIVVNRFDEVRDKERCKRVVLDQIKQLSPQTYAEGDELVHFVDSATVALSSQQDQELDVSFAHLERSLRSFVLVNRAKSKLGPAEHYLTHLMADVSLLARANAAVARDERDAARARLQGVRPGLETLAKGRDGLESGLDAEEDRLSAQVLAVAKQQLDAAVAGLIMGPKRLPPYPGLLGVWDYARDVRKALIRSLDHAVASLEDDTKRLTVVGVRNVAQLGDTYLPSDVERSRRVFNPDAMFASTSPKLSRRKSVTPLGLGLASRPELVQVNISDLFDLHHYVQAAQHVVASRGNSGPAAAPALGLAAGALTLYGGKLIAAKYTLDSVVSITRFIENRTVQRWAPPVVGAVVIASCVYIVYDLPRSIPRNVARQLQAALNASGFVGTESIRVQREARKVIRLASWDLRERFRAALEEKTKVVREGEEQERQAVMAMVWFEQVQERVQAVEQQMTLSK